MHVRQRARVLNKLASPGRTVEAVDGPRSSDITQQRVVLKVDHAEGEIIYGPPKRVQLFS